MSVVTAYAATARLAVSSVKKIVVRSVSMTVTSAVTVFVVIVAMIVFAIHVRSNRMSRKNKRHHRQRERIVVQPINRPKAAVAPAGQIVTPVPGKVVTPRKVIIPTGKKTVTPVVKAWSSEPAEPKLRFTPYAWAKLQWFCHKGHTEIGGFGITSAEDLLLIEDFVTLDQQASAAFVSFDDEAVADFYEDQVKAGKKPEEFGRIWCHTHPGSSPSPSGVDEETFTRVFGSCDWAVMFILAKGGQTYARLRFNAGPTGHMVIGVGVDYKDQFSEEHTEWGNEYTANITTTYAGVTQGYYGYGKGSGQISPAHAGLPHHQNNFYSTVDDWEQDFDDEELALMTGFAGKPGFADEPEDLMIEDLRADIEAEWPSLVGDGEVSATAMEEELARYRADNNLDEDFDEIEEVPGKDFPIDES